MHGTATHAQHVRGRLTNAQRFTANHQPPRHAGVGPPPVTGPRGDGWCRPSPRSRDVTHVEGSCARREAGAAQRKPGLHTPPGRPPAPGHTRVHAHTHTQTHLHSRARTRTTSCVWQRQVHAVPGGSSGQTTRPCQMHSRMQSTRTRTCAQPRPRRPPVHHTRQRSQADASPAARSPRPFSSCRRRRRADTARDAVSAVAVARQPLLSSCRILGHFSILQDPLN